MDDFETLAQLALDPTVTLTVIALLTLVIIGQHFDHERRLRNRLSEQAGRLGKLTSALVSAITIHMQRSERRKVFRAAEIAFKLKEANPELTLDELLFGEDPYKDVAEALYGEILPDLKEMRAVAASAILAKQYDWDRKQAAQVDAEFG